MTHLTHHQSVLPPCSLSERPSLLADYITLSKPRIAAMVVITASIGFALGSRSTAGMQWLALMATAIGTAMCCAGASVFNQVYERDTDALMHRTRHRPIPAGRIMPRPALAYAAVMSAAGVILIALLATPLAAGLALFTIVSYALIYTPMKRVSPMSLWIGAVPGALPPVIGFAGATGSIGPAAVAAFIIMFLWQVPHFLAIAWLYREDYTRAGFPMLAVLDPTGGSTFRQSLATCLALLPVGLLPTLWNISGGWYFIVAMLAGTGYLTFAILLAVGRTTGHARGMFLFSLIHLPTVLAMMLIDKV